MAKIRPPSVAQPAATSEEESHVGGEPHRRRATIREESDGPGGERLL